jgi:4-alpha-glucanotransferase
MSETPSVELRELARSYGVQLEYRDMSGRIKSASVDSLLAILKALGADLMSEADAPEALRERRLQRWRRGVDPVIVLWEEDGDGSIEIRIPEAIACAEFICRLESETDDAREWTVKVEKAVFSKVEGQPYLSFPVQMPAGLSTGYYDFSAQNLDTDFLASSFLIRAPRKAYQEPGAQGRRPWGVFCPLYSLHRNSSWGAGDFSDLEALIEWTAGQGGGLVATLPMLASNFDGPSPIISPYSPTSRLFWNEFYLDLNRIPELAECPAARALMESEETAREVEALRSGGLVDYGRQMKLKRAVLEVLAEWIHTSNQDQPEAYLEFRDRAGHPDVEDFAEFQAVGEQFGRDWRQWPQTSLGLTGLIQDSRAVYYHLYVQWKADEQLQALAEKTKEHGLTWYLDFPIGVDHNSFDVWMNREIFATGASVGCPPDPVFTKGQNWGFPPAHPDRQRESGYAYLIASIRNHLRYANALRIDHVMGLHRLFWIPQGAKAKDGAFVSTPAEEIYAILSVESHRHQAWLVGEDLGTVPPEVDRAMKQHNVRGMYVIQYEIRADEDEPLREVPESTIASVNTHDMPPFASFWSGLDLDDRKDLGLMDQARLEAERLVRDDQRQALIRFLVKEQRLKAGEIDPRAVLQAIHEWLAASASSVLLLNLEDLWFETEPQNTPNTYVERPNWRRKLRHRFEEFSIDPALREILRKIDQIRSGPREGPESTGP